jgi:hypothetical protein
MSFHRGSLVLLSLSASGRLSAIWLAAANIDSYARIEEGESLSTIIAVHENKAMTLTSVAQNDIPQWPQILLASDQAPLKIEMLSEQTQIVKGVLPPYLKRLKDLLSPRALKFCEDTLPVQLDYCLGRPAA